MEVVSPGPDELVLVSAHGVLNSPEFVHFPPSGTGQGYRFEPELGDVVALLDVDMGRFETLVAVEEEAHGTDLPLGRHSWAGSVPVDPEIEIAP